MAIAQRRGAAGEALAAAWFELRGERVEARNQKLGRVEVDLLVRSGRVLAVVEVKLRTRGDFGGAEAAVDAAKRRRLLDAARVLLARGEAAVRVDVVAIEIEPDGLRLRHLPNAVTDGG